MVVVWKNATPVLDDRFRALCAGILEHDGARPDGARVSTSGRRLDGRLDVRADGCQDGHLDGCQNFHVDGCQDGHGQDGLANSSNEIQSVHSFPLLQCISKHTNRQTYAPTAVRTNVQTAVQTTVQTVVQTNRQPYTQPCTNDGTDGPI